MQGILLDIEGTTTPIRFVYETLFPYARARTQAFLDEHAAEREIVEIRVELKAEHDREPGTTAVPPDWIEPGAAVAYVYWLMDRDRKSPALKRLQGLIWREGYRSGALCGEVFPDVPPALERWHRQGDDVRIFSSGSVLAQQLLFSSTPAGDLTRLLKGYFDTTIGSKTDSSSYARIAAQFNLPAAALMFISDVTRELDAARACGMSTRLAVRPGNPPQSGDHRVIASFDEL